MSWDDPRPAHPGSPRTTPWRSTPRERADGSIIRTSIDAEHLYGGQVVGYRDEGGGLWVVGGGGNPAIVVPEGEFAAAVAAHPDYSPRVVANRWSLLDAA